VISSKGANLIRGLEGPQAFGTRDFSYGTYAFSPYEQAGNEAGLHRCQNLGVIVQLTEFEMLW